MTEHNAQPSPRQAVGPAELLRESLHNQSWLLEVQEKEDEMVVEVSRWSAVILLQIPDTWDNRPVRVELRSRGKPGHPDYRRKGGTEP